MQESSEQEKYKTLISKIGWFFFDLFLFTYVEDYDTGLSFQIPGGLDWSIFIEVSFFVDAMSILRPIKQRKNLYTW